MTAANPPRPASSAPSQVRDEWISRVTALVLDLETWARDLGWSTRRIEKQLQDSEVGDHCVPALLLQEGPVRIFAEPIARAAPGADGVVDLYLMPAYDDIASLYFVEGRWQVHYMFPESPAEATVRVGAAEPLSKEALRNVLEAMSANAG